MSGNRTHDEAAVYEIKVEGKLGQDWSDWLEGLAITFDDDNSTLTGPVADQAALRGLLERIWDLNLAVISVRRLP